MTSELADLNEYSEAQLAELCRAWPAVDRYRALIQQRTDDRHRQFKLKRHRAWLRCAAALFYNTASDENVCRWWSQQSDQLLLEAAELVGLDTTKVAVFALGKLGAEELNLSSDIDLIFVRSNHEQQSVQEDCSAELTRAVQNLIQFLSENDEFGFCYRVDVSIRPGGRSGPLISTIDGFENHYGYYGETWERLALVRLRGLFGPSDVLSQIQSFATQYTYRKRIDLGLLDELRLLLSRIRMEQSERQAKFGAKEGRLHLKLDPGGIREIELLVHALLVIHGGRNPELRTHLTSDAIRRLVALGSGSLSPEDGELLRKSYWSLRAIENRLQCENDEQTYWLECVRSPNQCTEVQTVFDSVIGLSERLLPAERMSTTVNANELCALGISDTAAERITKEVDAIELYARNRERALSERNAFFRSFLDCLKGADRSQIELALDTLIDFLKSARAKSSLFSLLAQNLELVRKLALLFSNSPYGSSLLIRRPELLDGILFRRAAPASEEVETRLMQLQETHQIHEVIATLHLLDRSGSEGPSQSASVLADSIATEVMKEACQATGADDIHIVALGKWGGLELGIRSDLDFVLVSSNPPDEDQHRACRRFLNWIQSIYPIDLRLRPSGSAGPILISQDALLDYLAGPAMAWERQSWLRMRTLPIVPIANSVQSTKLGVDDPLRIKVLQVILGRGLSESDKAELIKIQNLLLQPLPQLTGDLASVPAVDLKLSRGGLTEIEFAGQISHFKLGPQSPLLNHKLETFSNRLFLQSLRDQAFFLSNEEIAELSQTYEWLRTIEQLHRLTSETSASKLMRRGSGYEYLSLLAARQGLLGEAEIGTTERFGKDLLGFALIKLEKSSRILQKVWDKL